MRTYAWTLRYRNNGSMMRIKTDHPIKTLLFKSKREADEHRNTLVFKDTIITARVEIRIEPKLNLRSYYC